MFVYQRLGSGLVSSNLICLFCANLNSEVITSNFQLSVFDHILLLIALDLLKNHNNMHLFHS